MKLNFDFALTTHCQAKCRSCARTNPATGEKADWLELRHMDLGVFRNTLKNAAVDINQIQFCGEFGDPMMHPQVENFVDSALEHASRVQINTNGGLRNPQWYHDMAIKYPGRLGIKWGIDGTDAVTNSKYREGVNWDRAIDNMSSWFSAGGDGKWHFIIFEWNWFQVPSAKLLAQDIGCEIEFKVNNRSWGKISLENLIKVKDLI